MILKGSQRGGAKQLAAHLLKTEENEHVTVHEVRGFVAQDLHGALYEAYGVSRGTRCQQFLFSVSLNPPPEEAVHIDVFDDAVARIEERNGLTGQPKIVVFHEKEGRRHAHAVWSRIDAETMTAKQMSFYKNKLREISKELYLENDWQMPRGLMDSKERNPANFSLDEWQQAKRAGLDAGVLKSTIQECWAVSDSRASFAAALEGHGLYLARGDRRGYVALSFEGEPFAIARATGKKSKEVQNRLGDPSEWRSVDETKAHIAAQIVPNLQRHIDHAKLEHQARIEPLHAERLGMRQRHATDRATLERDQAERQAQEAHERAERLRRGVLGLWDRLTGRRSETVRQNEREQQEAEQRDRNQRDAIIAAQLCERRKLQTQIVAERERHAEDVRDIHRDVERYQRFSPESSVQQEPAQALNGPENSISMRDQFTQTTQPKASSSSHAVSSSSVEPPDHSIER